MFGAARLAFYLEVLLILFLGYSFQGCDGQAAKLTASCHKICKIAFGDPPQPPRIAVGSVWCTGEMSTHPEMLKTREAKSEMLPQCDACKDKFEEAGCMPVGDGSAVSKGCEFDFCVMGKLLALKGPNETPIGYSVHPDLHGDITAEAAAKRELDRGAPRRPAAEPPKPAEPPASSAPAQGPPKQPASYEPALPPSPAKPPGSPPEVNVAAAAGRGAAAGGPAAKGDEAPASAAVLPSGDVAPFRAAAGAFVDTGPAGKTTLAQARVHNA